MWTTNRPSESCAVTTKTDRPLSVSELTARIKVLLERAFAQVAVLGEVADLRRAQSGHWYFSIKDAHASLRAVLWRSTAGRLALLPENGQQFVFHGSLQIYEKRGEYQLVVSRIEPALDKEGLLAAEFERRKRSFAAKGLFANQRPLPRWPKRIAVVTSPQAAAWRDVRKVLASRPGWLEILLSPCLVQGEQAAPSIARAIERAARARPDLVLVVRGGGSLEDLWCFNDERVVRAIFSCPVPVISGIGHETDTTLADFAADCRAATPSQAAELVCPSREELRKRIPNRNRLLGALLRLVREKRASAEHARDRLRAAGNGRLFFWHRRIDDAFSALLQASRQGVQRRRITLRAFERRLLQQQPLAMLRRRRDALFRLAARAGASYERAITQMRKQLHEQTMRLRNGTAQRLQRNRQACLQLRTKLHALGPEQVLARGYLLCEGKDGRLRTRASSLREGEPITLRFFDGKAGGKIEWVQQQD